MRTGAEVMRDFNFKKGALLGQSPDEPDVFQSEVMKGSHMMGEVRYESSVEVDESDKGLNFFLIHRSGPFGHACDLDRVHLDVVVRDYHTEVFNPSLLKLTLLILEVELVLAEALHDKSGYLSVFREVFREDQDVVKVYGDDAFSDEIFKYLIHHHLEGGRAIGETKIHDEGFK